jgi:replicative DNA helicase
VSVTEMPQRGDEFERMPPHDMAAEQCVLGGMLLSKDAISDVIEVIRPTDHYRPAHQLVHEAILDLYARGEPADPITVANELTRRGELTRIGGAPYLHTLIASVPTAANAGFYARIVRERAILRRLVEAGTRIVQYGYAGDADADELVDRAQAEVYAVADRRTSEDYRPLSEIMPGALEEIEAIGAHGGGISGVPTGFADLDALTNGLHSGQMIVIAARPAVGKALALDTPLPTPDGWTTMGEVQPGDHLIGADGKLVRVVATTEVMLGRSCYEVEFSDGTVIVADAEHQWRTTTRAGRRQASDGHASWHWSEESRKRLRNACTAALAEPDRAVTTAEVLAVVGKEFGSAIHAAGSTVGLASTRISQTYTQQGKPYTWNAPAYMSRHALLSGMVQRADRRVGDWSRVEHAEIFTTREIAATLRTGTERRPNHAVAVASPAELPDVDLLVQPYTLGAWLGDGHSNGSRITSADPEIIAEIESEGYVAVRERESIVYGLRLPETERKARSCIVCGKKFLPKAPQVRTCGRSCGGKLRSQRWRGQAGLASLPACSACGKPTLGGTWCGKCYLEEGNLKALLRKAGVLGNKHIPAQYLRASEAQRRALLAGLLDTDGYVSKDGRVQFAVTNERLAHDTHELILSLGYQATMTTKPVRGRTQTSSTCYMITFTPGDPVCRLPRKLARQRTTVHPKARTRYITDVRPCASVPVRCVEVDSVDHMYLAGPTWIPTHNSALALDFARSAAIKHGLPTVVFSLEMGRNEITMRLLSAEARVPMHIMRTGQMSDEDWGRLAKRMSEVADAPLFIDDSPNMSLMEIRAKCRRLKQRHDLKLVIIDYLQLMSSPSKSESRQQEVSAMSRSLKLLAKELEIPLIALSQLNRGPEQRQDKKPMLSDLRESGCLTGDTKLLRADTGTEITLDQLMASNAMNIPVWSLDERLKLVPQTLTHAFPSGVKEVFKVRLASGREVQATANHPFLTYGGWESLGELSVGARVAISRTTPSPLAERQMPNHELIMLAHMLGDGSFVRRQPIRYASVDEENLAAVTEAATHFGVTAVRDEHPAARCTSLRLPAPYKLTHGRRNPIAQWLGSLGLFGLRSHEKFVPDAVFSLPTEQLALFLRHLWATDGSVTVAKSGDVRIYFATTSEMMARQLLALLLRFGIVGRLRAVGNSYGHPQWTVDITGIEEQSRFIDEIGVHGKRGTLAQAARLRLSEMTAAGRFDTIPSEVWSRVRETLTERAMSRRQLQLAVGTRSRGDLDEGICPSRSRLGRIAGILEDSQLEMVASNDVFWDTIASIESVGLRDVYDATVLGMHNFVANGINLHNSIEQDADMVILLHREDAYERESPRAGEADLIVAKHRNGPTATVTVAFQGHYSRFVDMAPG